MLSNGRAAIERLGDRRRHAGLLREIGFADGVGVDDALRLANLRESRRREQQRERECNESSHDVLPEPSAGCLNV